MKYSSFFQKLLFPFIIMQLIVVVFLGYKILHKKNNVLGSSIKVNTINRNEIVYTPDQKLRYFFEPVPKSTQTDKRNWMDKEVKVIFGRRRNISFNPRERIILSYHFLPWSSIPSCRAVNFACQKFFEFN